MSISVLTIGAGGAFGQPLLQEFIRQKASFKTVAILAVNKQKADKFAWTEGEGAKIVVGSFLDPAPYSGTAFKHRITCFQLTNELGFTHVISVVGNPILRLQSSMIEVAISAGVTHFYPSEWNSNISQREIYSMRYFRDKQVTRSHLAAVARLHPEFRYTLLITGIFTKWAVGGSDHQSNRVAVYGRLDASVGVTSIPEYVPRALYCSLFVRK
jgi:hypothetical protein